MLCWRTKAHRAWRKARSAKSGGQRAESRGERAKERRAQGASRLAGFEEETRPHSSFPHGCASHGLIGVGYSFHKNDRILNKLADIAIIGKQLIGR